MKATFATATIGQLAWLASCASANYLPKLYSVGSNITSEGLKPYHHNEITLSKKSSVATLDYGAEVAGFPFVVVESPSAPVQIELKYSEPYAGLAEPQSDGPWMFTLGLMNSFRTETFNISSSGKTQSFFLQGGQRWQAITHLSGPPLKITNIGFKPSVDIKEPSGGGLPGSFSASKDIYQKVWDLGTRAVQAACVDANSQPSTWEIDRKNGAYIRGQFPGVSAKAVTFEMYTLEFYTKITRGGTGWRVAGGANDGYGAYFLLTSTGPELESPAITPFPRNQLTANFGFTLINQQILPSSPVQTYNITNATIEDNTWYKITTKIGETGYTVSVNDKEIAFVDNSAFAAYNNPGWGSGSLTTGSFGFAPFLNQAAWYKDVKVTAQNGSVIYTNDLTSTDILQEFSVAANDRSVCLDGAKRDRIIWIGDYAHTCRTIAVSTGRFDILKSMIDLEYDWQFPSGPAAGLVPMQPFMGTGKEFRETFYPTQYGETDYEFFFMLVVSEYFAVTNDVATMKQYWQGTKMLVQTLVERYLDPSNNLMANSSASWFTAQGVQNATAPTALFVAGLNGLINIADAIGDTSTASSWTKLSDKISSAVNKELWNDDLGAYAFCTSQMNVSAILATAFTIRGGIADQDKATKSIEALSGSFLKIGYKDNSAASDASTTQLSPNTQGFLFDALFLAHLNLNVSAATVVPAIRNLGEVFWPQMVTQNEYYTGASWEYLFQDGSPGIGLFTSLSHPWGGAATYVYTNYILGLRTEWNAGSKSYQWVFDPAWEVAEGLGLTSAEGTVPLSGGGYIKASWSTSSKAQSSKGSPQMTVNVVGNSNVKVDVKRSG